MNKVLLIFPPYSLQEEFGALSDVGNMLPPLGIGYLGSSLRQAGFKVKIIDAPPLGLGVSEVVNQAKKYSPDLIGLSISTVDFYKALKLAQALKKKLEVPIVVGGPHVTALPEEVIGDKAFNYGVIGEGEETLTALALHLAEKK